MQTKSGFFAFSVEQFSKLFPPCVSASAPRRVVLANPTCGPACIFRRTTARITVQRTVLHCFRAALANPTCGPACIFRRTTARITVRRTVLHCFRAVPAKLTCGPGRLTATFSGLSPNSASRSDRFNIKMENHTEVSPGRFRSRWVPISKIQSHTKNTSCIISILSVGLGFQPYSSF